MADSGTSLNLMPEHDYKRIYNYFFKGKFRCQRLKNTLTMCDCTQQEHESIPDIHFTLDGTEYKINRDQWFERAPEYNKCVIKIMHGPHKPYWILGLNFFTNYYTVFDYKNMQIGFAESINMGKPMNKGFINWCLSSAGLLQENDEKTKTETEKETEVDGKAAETTDDGYPHEEPKEYQDEDHHHRSGHHHRHGRHHHRHHHHRETAESSAEPGLLTGYS